jgi:hypothetical protein
MAGVSGTAWSSLFFILAEKIYLIAISLQFGRLFALKAE